MPEIKNERKVVAFIVMTGEGDDLKYRAWLGECHDSAGDNDQFIDLQYTRPATRDLQQAVTQVESTTAFANEICTVPIRFDRYVDGILWYSTLKEAQKTK